MLRRDFVDLSSRLAIARILDLHQPLAEGIRDVARGPRERPSVLPPPYLDAHAHTASAALVAYRAATGAPKGIDSPTGGAALIRRMDADGVRRAFVLSTAYQMAADAYGPRALDLQGASASAATTISRRRSARYTPIGSSLS
jgi:hypothetical protein